MVIFQAKNPRRAIPVAIIVTLIMVIIAYVSCSAVMTLMGMNYDDLHNTLHVIMKLLSMIIH